MRPKSIVLLVLALGCGLVASIGINQVMANRHAVAARGSVETTPIFVALGEIGIGDPLTAEMLKLEEWPKEKVPAGAASKLEDIEGRRCKQRFYPGEPILEAKLLAPGEKGQSPTDLIPKGYRVVSIRVDAVSSSSGMILPGDRVDLLVHVQENPGKGIHQARTQTFLQNVKVFAVDDLFSRDNESTVSAKTISLLVTPDQAELVMLAGNLGTLQLAMRSASDDTNDPTSGADVQELLSGTDNATARGTVPTPVQTKADLLSLLNQAPEKAPEPAAAPAAPEIAAAPAPPELFEMLIIKGPHAETLQFSDVRRPPSAPLNSSPFSAGDSLAPPGGLAPANGAGPEGDSAPASDAEPSAGGASSPDSAASSEEQPAGEASGAN
ncbi:MAG TPA: Flp pilus assembly protein CpaB [Thermomicrobiales bacterium]|nr:Flp pilus assembly protein CpaB [Thermomicrobiales bacterium]